MSNSPSRAELPQPAYILVVEDDDDIREAVIDVFADGGYRARGVENGRAALAALRDGSPRPAVILLDLMMPIMDGPTFRAAQLADDDLRELPVVVMTASAQIHETAEQLGAVSFLKKPVPLSELIAVAKRYL